MSRFDLFFVVIDHKDPVADRAIANHIVSLHQYGSMANTEARSATTPFTRPQSTETAPPYLRPRASLQHISIPRSTPSSYAPPPHSPPPLFYHAGSRNPSCSQIQPEFTTSELQRYIRYARALKPVCHPPSPPCSVGMLTVYEGLPKSTHIAPSPECLTYDRKRALLAVIT